jgi:TonB family protein
MKISYETNILNMKTTLIALLVLITLSATAQKRQINQGEAPRVNYYDSAMQKKEAGDHCGYCAYLIKATTFGNTLSGKQYRDDCVKVDTIRYADDPATGSRRFSIITNVPCNLHKEQTFCVSEPGKTSGVIYIVMGPDGQPITEQLKEFPDKETDQFTFLYYITEDMPAYKGGDDARIRFLQENIRYPEEGKVNGLQGKVFVSFIISENGTLSGLKVLRGVSKSLDDEALRVIGMMPPWTPGKVKGKPVKCQFVLPIKFTLQ